ncbi:hypothetical protein F503_01174 [Ophiostoma piceae UAMH 11346]|uniref:Ankyrin repeat protein n=1 Tax=Ophiostoma piceae (strain UAMH 11346) TaxID=1262450 RepID=S3C8X4_OPHP1|nr:hypothetical protein F503_01174 [Ophiostoma piceae UAMH 11346]
MFAALSSIRGRPFFGGAGRGRGTVRDDNNNNDRDNSNSNNGAPSRGMFSFSNNQNGDDDDDDDDDDGLYLPSYADVFVVKAMLGHAGNLPLELVDTIIDHAEYWPHTHVEAKSTQLGGITVPSRSFSTSANNLFLCRTPPLGFTKAPVAEKDSSTEYSSRRLEPQPLPNSDSAHPGHDSTCLPDTIQGWLPAQQPKPVEHPCRKIVFTIVSRDQGWANNQQDRGTYKGSYSWFDAGLERYGRASETSHEDEGDPSHSSMPPDVKLYSISPAVVETDAPPTETQPRSYTYSFPLLPGNDRLQSNRVAIRQWTKHKVVWSWADGGGPKGEDIAADHLVHGTQRNLTGRDGEEAAADEGTEGIAGTEGADDAEASDETEEHPLDKIGRGSATGDGEFVRNLCIGDVVTVWAKARFPGWVNSVQSIQVDVFWAV